MFLAKSLAYALNPTTSGRIIPRMATYIKYMEDQALSVYDRFREPQGLLTQTVMLLNQVIWRCDPQYLAKTEDDPFYVYENILIPAIHSVRLIFDPVQSRGRQVSDLVMDPSKTCYEFLFPVSDDRPVENLPIGEEWGAWKNVQVLRMVDVDTSELSLLFYLNAIDFKIEKPRYAVFTLNTAALVMKFVAYLRKRDTGIDNLQEITVDFIHRHVITECFLHDELTLWFLKNYSQVLDVALNREEGPVQALDPVRDTPWLSATYARTGSQYSSVFTEFLKVCNEVKQGSLTVPRLLESIKLPFGHTLISKFNELQTESEFFNLRQYRWGEFLQNYPILQIVVKALLLDPSHPQVSKVAVYLRRDMQLFYMSHPWTDITNPIVRDRVEGAITEFRDSVQDLFDKTQTS